MSGELDTGPAANIARRGRLRPLNGHRDRLPPPWAVIGALVLAAVASLLLAGLGWPGMAVVIGIQLSALLYLLRAASWPPPATDTSTDKPSA